MREKTACPSCDSRNDADAVYCKRCGSRLGFECPECDKVNDSDAAYCNRCGGRLNVSPTPGAGGSSRDQSPARRRAPSIEEALRTERNDRKPLPPTIDEAMRQQASREDRSSDHEDEVDTKRSSGSVVPWLIGTLVFTGVIALGIAPSKYRFAAQIGGAVGAAALGGFVCVFTRRAMLGTVAARAGCVSLVLAAAGLVIFITHVYGSLVGLSVGFVAGLLAARQRA